MSSQRSKRFDVPAELPTLLKDFTREVLRQQPTKDEFYQFAADHFGQLLADESARASPQGTGMGMLSTEELEALLLELFIDADEDRSGALSVAEFKALFQKADLGLSERDARSIYALVDVNQDGEISYEEFIPAAVELIQAMYARVETEMQEAAAQDESRQEARKYLHGFSREELEGVIRQSFEQADVDGSGTLDAEEFRQCIRTADVGLTRQEANMLMAFADADGDGKVSYDEFVPICFDLLVEVVSNDLLRSKKTETAQAIEEYLLAIWAEADHGRTGSLAPRVLSRLIREADLGLTHVQVHSVVGYGAQLDDGTIDYVSLAPKAAQIIERLGSEEGQMERWEKVQALQDGDRVHGMYKDDFDEALRQALSAYDPSGTGAVSIQDWVDALSNSPIGFTAREIGGLFSLVENDCLLEDGTVDWAAFASCAWYVALYIAQDQDVYGLD